MPPWCSQPRRRESICLVAAVPRRGGVPAASRLRRMPDDIKLQRPPFAALGDIDMTGTHCSDGACHEVRLAVEGTRPSAAAFPAGSTDPRSPDLTFQCRRLAMPGCGSAEIPDPQCRTSRTLPGNRLGVRRTCRRQAVARLKRRCATCTRFFHLPGDAGRGEWATRWLKCLRAASAARTFPTAEASWEAITAGC